MGKKHGHCWVLSAWQLTLSQDESSHDFWIGSLPCEPWWRPPMHPPCQEWWRHLCCRSRASLTCSWWPEWLKKLDSTVGRELAKFCRYYSTHSTILVCTSLPGFKTALCWLLVEDSHCSLESCRLEIATITSSRGMFRQEIEEVDFILCCPWCSTVFGHFDGEFRGNLQQESVKVTKRNMTLICQLSPISVNLASQIDHSGCKLSQFHKALRIILTT